MPLKSKALVRARVRTQEGQGGGERRERSMRLEIGTERGMHAELSFYIHLHASMGSAAAAGWSRQREYAAAQCDSLCSAASTVSSLSMRLCDVHHSSVSSPREQARLFDGSAPNKTTTLAAGSTVCNPAWVSSAATLTARRCWRPGPARRLQCRALASS
mmetsp:Transcript_54077/g.87520  ORF Transcript_54077/g.87520 Transcript_54077/m.87520 type:complete len:159 (-) Transcript_54077:82-558(-)